MNIDSFLKELMFSVVMVEAEGLDGSKWTGTAFLYQLRQPNNIYTPYLVSNRHVFKNASRLTFYFVRAEKGQPKFGNAVAYTIDDAYKIVKIHPNLNIDIAAIPMAFIMKKLSDEKVGVFYKFFEEHMLPTQEAIDRLDLAENVIFAGYPSGIFDQENFTPIIRRGILATPIQLNYNGLPAFVIDGAVFGGSSGSPVILLESAFGQRDGAMTVSPGGIYLVGIVAEVHLSREEGKLVPASNLPLVEVNIPNGLGIVYRWDAIVNFLNDIYEQDTSSKAPVKLVF